MLADMHDERQAGDRGYLSDTSKAEIYPTPGSEPDAELESGDSTPRINPETPPLQRAPAQHTSVADFIRSYVYAHH